MNPSQRTEKQLARQIGAMARQARLQRDLTQAEVAERVGIVTEVYGRLERGIMMPRVSTLRNVCLTLRLDANEVLGLWEQEPPGTRLAPLFEEEAPRSLRRVCELARPLSAWNRNLLSRVARQMGRSQEARKTRRLQQNKATEVEVRP